MNARRVNPMVWTAAATMALAVTVSQRAWSQSEPQPPSPVQDEPEKPAKPATLDDLLGIEEAPDEEAPSDPADAAEREVDEELQRRLNEAEIADSFTQAIEKMSISADLLDTQFDPGLGTQRVQEDILAKLAQLIDQAKKSQCKAGSSSSSSSAKSSSAPKSNPGQKPGDPASAAQPNNRPGDSREGDPPPMQQGDVNTLIDETRTEWGNLPQRVRDMLLQGRKDKFSSLYRRFTDEYYKRLAEDDAP